MPSTYMDVTWTPCLLLRQSMEGLYTMNTLPEKKSKIPAQMKD